MSDSESDRGSNSESEWEQEKTNENKGLITLKYVQKTDRVGIVAAIAQRVRLQERKSNTEKQKCDGADLR